MVASNVRTTKVDLQLPGIAQLVADHAEGRRDVRDTVREAAARARADTHNAWIHVLGDDVLDTYVAALEDADGSQLSLLGVPFAIKDNIDLAGAPTTAACPAFSYVPKADAAVVARLIEAGAIPIGKTNLDQFATGLVGARSPYGVTRNAIRDEMISGGSSSGSAVSVALGQVLFSLGTDTAGSGRVPAAFNNLFGHKPTRGWLSARGVVPACRSLDCVSVFARDPHDAARVFTVAGVFDAEDAFARVLPEAPAPTAIGDPFDFGVPRLEGEVAIANAHDRNQFESTVACLEALGGRPRPIDLAVFLEAAKLLYDGPWLAERLLVTGEWIEHHPDALHPVTREVLEKGKGLDACSVFRAQERLAELRRSSDALLADIEFLLLPTAVCNYSLAEVESDPIATNARLGLLTNFVNLLDLSASAVPAGFRPDGTPFGVTLLGPAGHDARLLSRAAQLQPLRVSHAGAGLPFDESAGLDIRGLGGPWFDIAVCGAHLEGQPLNHQLLARRGVLVERTTTATDYRLYALPGGPPQRPALVRQEGGGEIEIEIWRLPESTVASFLAGIAAPLGLGNVETRSGQSVCGFVCEHGGISGAVDITSFGGWRGWLRESMV